MSAKRVGCQACSFDVWGLDGERKCTKRPFDMATPEQRAIVRWLCEPGRDAFQEAGCPGFIHWLDRTTSAKDEKP